MTVQCFELQHRREAKVPWLTGIKTKVMGPS